MLETWETQTNETLCIEYQETKNNQLFEYFLSRNIGLIMDYVSPIIQNHPDQKEELIETCKVAMWEAMLKWKPEREVKFTTYVYWFFKKNIWHHLHSQYSVRIPINLMNKLDEVREKTPYAALEFDSLNREICIGEESDHETTLEDIIASTDPSPEEVLMQHNVNEVLLQFIDRLRPRESNCIKMYFGLDGHTPCTLQVIGDKYHVTRERIRQVIEKGIKKLKVICREEGYKNEDF